MNDTTAYNPATPEHLRAILERARLNHWRIRLYFGDTETGRDWNEWHGTTGRIGRSMGPSKIPILLHNSRCYGGGAILDHCIVKIEFANKKDGGTLYQHPKYYLDAAVATWEAPA